MLDIFDRIERDSGGPIGQYYDQAFGYYMYPKLEGELGPHMVFNGKEYRKQWVKQSKKYGMVSMVC